MFFTFSYNTVKVKVKAMIRYVDIVQIVFTAYSFIQHFQMFGTLLLDCGFIR